MNALPPKWKGKLMMVDHMGGFVSEMHIYSIYVLLIQSVVTYCRTSLLSLFSGLQAVPSVPRN